MAENYSPWFCKVLKPLPLTAVPIVRDDVEVERVENQVVTAMIENPMGRKHIVDIEVVRHEAMIVIPNLEISESSSWGMQEGPTETDTQEWTEHVEANGNVWYTNNCESTWVLPEGATVVRRVNEC